MLCMCRTWGLSSFAVKYLELEVMCFSVLRFSLSSGVFVRWLKVIM